MSRKLTPSERNAIRRALENCDDAVESVQTDYSGRFMYGQECFGIVTSDPFRLVGSMSMSLGMDGYDDLAIDLYSNTCTDNMGMSKIVYFPDVDWNADAPEDLDSFFEEEDEEDEY